MERVKIKEMNTIMKKFRIEPYLLPEPCDFSVFFFVFFSKKGAGESEYIDSLQALKMISKSAIQRLMNFKESVIPDQCLWN